MPYALLECRPNFAFFQNDIRPANVVASLNHKADLPPFGTRELVFPHRFVILILRDTVRIASINPFAFFLIWGGPWVKPYLSRASFAPLYRIGQFEPAVSLPVLF